jgi:hypothetical protein
MRSDREDANRGQPTLAHLKSDLDGLKPDITLLCEKLALFAGIWASVRFRVYFTTFVGFSFWL